MARVISFSTKFQSTHPRKSEQTYFVEKIWTSFREMVHFKPNEPTHFYTNPEELFELNKNLSYDVISDFIRQIGNYTDKFEPKHHTIRQGYRWKVGDKFSPRVWSGKPYASKQITIAPDIEIKKIWNVDIFMLEGRLHAGIPEANNMHRLLPLNQIATNDGLTFEDMRDWFNVKENKPFNGQIICWNENINY